jgi:ABC-2 type transport system permease protein
MDKVWVIFRKEWFEITQQKALVLTMVLPPLLFVLVPLIAIWGTGLIPTSDMDDIRDLNDVFSKLYPAMQQMNEREVVQTVTGQQLSVLFLLMPVILPSVIASYSVVGEKTSQTLEPVLATPVETWELLLAKGLSSLIPSVGLTWLSALLYIPGVYLVASPLVAQTLISPGWALAVLLWGPLLSLITILLTLAVSSRANDPRTAQQVSVVAILPVMGLFMGQIFGVLSISPLVVLIGAVGLAIIAAICLVITVNLFQRETILTRWS